MYVVDSGKRLPSIPFGAIGTKMYTTFLEIEHSGVPHIWMIREGL
jgi:hypothetical protein